MLHQWVYELFDIFLFGVVVILLAFRFCVVEFGNKTYVPLFKFVADVNREFIWESIFCRPNSFLVLSDKFHCAFYLCVKSIRYVHWKLILKFVSDETSLHRGYAVVDCNKLILY